MRRAARIDANQNAIVKALRDSGVSVWITSQMGHGGPDAVVGVNGKCVLIEIKDGEKRAWERKLSPDEQAFRSSWRGRYEVIESVDQALALCASMREAV